MFIFSNTFLSPPSPIRSNAPAADRWIDLEANTAQKYGKGDIDRHGIDMPPDAGRQEAAPELQDLLAAIHARGFIQAIIDLIAPQMEPGAPGRTAVDRTGLFNVNQLAVEVPTGFPGISGKYGLQVNVVKPDIRTHHGQYHLQLFPIHDEIGFNPPQALKSLLPEGILPEWCGLSAQIVRNHGFDIPLTHSESGWQRSGSDDGIAYLDEWVVRPLELDLKYLGTPAQATVGLELGAHFKWSLDNPNWFAASMATLAANLAGVLPGLLAGAAMVGTGGGVGSGMMMMHGGAMAAQLAMHGLQYWSGALCPDQILTWAGATFSAADVNQSLLGGPGRVTEYPRIWAHAYDGCWQKQATAAVAPIVRRTASFRAIEMAEMGLDGSVYLPGTPLPTISQRYAAQL